MRMLQLHSTTRTQVPWFLYQMEQLRRSWKPMGVCKRVLCLPRWWYPLHHLMQTYLVAIHGTGTQIRWCDTVLQSRCSLSGVTCLCSTRSKVCTPLFIVDGCVQHQTLPHQDGGTDQPVHLVSHPHAVQDQHTADQGVASAAMQSKDVSNDRPDVSNAAPDAYGLAYGSVADLNPANEGTPVNARIAPTREPALSSQVHGSESQVRSQCLGV